jgi:hypothetical protein
MDNLKKKHVILVNRCCMCKQNEESVNHLLIHCDVTHALWSAIFTHFGLSWVMPRRVLDLFACWWTSGRPRVPRFGRWCRHAFFGVFGMKEIIGVSRIWSGPCRVF